MKCLFEDYENQPKELSEMYLKLNNQKTVKMETTLYRIIAANGITYEETLPNTAIDYNKQCKDIKRHIIKYIRQVYNSQICIRDIVNGTYKVLFDAYNCFEGVTYKL